MKKRLWMFAGAGVVVLTITAYFFFFGTNATIQSALKKYGSALTQTAIDIGDVDFSRHTGQGTINYFRLSNPLYFWAPRAIKTDIIDFQIDPETIDGTQPIVIEVMNINSPVLTFGLSTVGKSNFEILDQNVEIAVPKILPDRKIIIKNLYIRDGTITIMHPLLRLRRFNTALPMMHLTDIGTSGGLGATPQEIADTILSALSQQTGAVTAALLAKEISSSPIYNSSAIKSKANPLKNIRR